MLTDEQEQKRETLQRQTHKDEMHVSRRSIGTDWSSVAKFRSLIKKMAGLEKPRFVWINF